MQDEPKGAGEEPATAEPGLKGSGRGLDARPRPAPDAADDSRSGPGDNRWLEDFAKGDAVERAVRDLTGVGLLRCPSGLAVPSPAALRFLKVIAEGGA